MNPLVYSDKVPTVPGWYWRRGPSGVQIVKLPEIRDGIEMRLIHWRERREEAIEHWPESSRKKALKNDDGWRVDYAGPIPEPIDQAESVEQQEREWQAGMRQ